MMGLGEDDLDMAEYENPSAPLVNKPDSNLNS